MGTYQEPAQVWVWGDCLGRRLGRFPNQCHRACVDQALIDFKVDIHVQSVGNAAGQDPRPTNDEGGLNGHKARLAAVLHCPIHISKICPASHQVIQQERILNLTSFQKKQIITLFATLLTRLFICFYY